MTKRFFSSIVIVILLTTVCVTAHWNGFNMPESKEESLDLFVGRWIYGSKIYNADSFIGKDDIIIKNGRLYIAEMDINKDDANHNPDNPNGSFWSSMRYSELTDEYRSFNYYESGDYVFYNGILYKRDAWYPHSPNTISAQNPVEGGWAVNTQFGEQAKPWFRYKVYFKGDFVWDDNGDKYECILEPCVKRGISEYNYWRKI